MASFALLAAVDPNAVKACPIDENPGIEHRMLALPARVGLVRSSETKSATGLETGRCAAEPRAIVRSNRSRPVERLAAASTLRS